MKRILQVPLQLNENINSFLLASPFFEFTLWNTQEGIQYYIHCDQEMLQLLENKGYRFEEAELSMDFIDCGGRMGYNFTKRNIETKQSKLELDYKDFVELLNEYPDQAIRIKIEYKNEISLATKRRIQLLERNNKITMNPILQETMNINDLYEVTIQTTSFSLMNSLQQNYHLVNNHLSQLDEITHCYSSKDLEINLLPKQENSIQTPQVNLNQMFEENNATNIIHHIDSIFLGKDKNYMDTGIHMNDFLFDVGVFGASGSGKGNILFKMLEQFHNKVPFLVIAPKGELSNLSQRYKDIQVYDPTKYLPLNIFMIPKNQTLQEYLPHLKELLTILLELDESPSAKSFVSDAIKKTYYLHNYTMQSTWDKGTPFSIRDFALILEETIKQSQYAKNEKNNFLQIINNRLSNCLDLSTVFDDVNCMNIEELLRKNTIIDLKNTPKEMMILVMKILLFLVIQHIKKQEPVKQLKNLIVIDEAHNLFGKEDDYFDHTFADVLFELRSFGCGFVISDQRMSTLKENVLDNLSQTINGRLVRGDEEYFFESKNYDQKQKEMMSVLPTGMYALKVRATTLPYAPALIHPVIIQNENIIDEYIHQSNVVTYKLQHQPYSHCANCKSKELCLYNEELREFARSLIYKYNYKNMSKEDKIKVIVHELKNKEFTMLDLKDACMCVYQLTKWEERRG